MAGGGTDSAGVVRRGGIAASRGLGVAVSLATGGAALLAAGTLMVGAGPAGASGSTGRSPLGIHASAKGSVVARHGATLVAYPGSAHVEGSVSGAAGARDVVLQSEAFPFRSGWGHRVVKRTSAHGAFTYRVSPSAATRYRVFVLSAPRVKTATMTVYVTSSNRHFHYTSSSGCSALAPTTCHLDVHQTIVLPPAVAKSEAAKHRYLYVGVTVGTGSGGKPPAPSRLRLQPSGRVTLARTSVRGKYNTTVTLSYSVPSQYRTTGWHANWRFEWCSKETFHHNGFGLPFHYACGSSSIPASSQDLHSLG
jgi:hypothetical protein